MEVADQWQREWAGTAEYGKVTEGGVTRQVARAMEVLHASGPGARVRVMRAAYHSSAGPGAPAASFMLHSSRRVISSGFNFLESPTTPTLPIKPLEISSLPLESSPDSVIEPENYKVTEPDDFEISEPSKWRASTRGSSIRMPSEESSSTDNASIIDLDSRFGRNLHRKYSYDSESSDVHFRSRSNSRNSPLLDPPVSLSTLKYKSLLNSSNEWNNRRKSYSFEDTSPLNETILHNNETLAMESSTDSGICKSTEIVNDHDDNTYKKHFAKDDRKTFNNEDTFKDWLSKNRPSSQYRGTKFKTYREHDIVLEDPKENNISLQSSGKVSITLPITVESDDYLSKNQMNEDSERKIKKVEFCKTEVHFAAESGKVNIIATDEKPPPSNDFRKRRSAFVPLHDMIDKPITLFGERNDFSIHNRISPSLNQNGNEFSESDENTAATKSILKNKIPKPKPYLLGENMRFGISDNNSNKDYYGNDSVLTAVSLVNKQLESENRYNGDIRPALPMDTEQTVTRNNAFRTINSGPPESDSLKIGKQVVKNIKIEKVTDETINNVITKLDGLHMPSTQVKPRTRQLRDSDLTYFGIDNEKKWDHRDRPKPVESKLTNNDDMFHSVKLIKEVSNSVCSSEPESEESPEYQNIPLTSINAPIPTPRMRSKYDDKLNEIHEIEVLKPIVEKNINDTKAAITSCHTRRTRLRKQEETITNRSLSEPPKAFRLHNLIEKSHSREDQSLRSSKDRAVKENTKNDMKIISPKHKEILDDSPIYVNLDVNTKNLSTSVEKQSNSHGIRQRKSHNFDGDIHKNEKSEDIPISKKYTTRIKEHRSDSGSNSSLRKKHSSRDKPSLRSINQHTNTDSSHRDSNSPSLNKNSKSGSLNKHKLSQSDDQNSLKHSVKKDTVSKQVELSAKSRDSSENRKNTHEKLSKGSTAHKYHDINNKDHKNTMEKREHRTRSSQKTSPKIISEDITKNHPSVKSAEIKDKEIPINQTNTGSRVKNTSKHKDNTKLSQNLDTNSTVRLSSAQSRNSGTYGGKSNSYKANQRSEYVINYDDKNGTVSSICKIKPSFITPRRKKTSKEISNKENHKDNSLKNKTIDKIALRK